MANKQKVALTIRHLAFEDLGLFERVLEASGYAVRYLEAGMDELTWIEPLDPDLLIILGGPISANDSERFPFLQDELALLETRLHAGAPTLGICLGAQLMARALGGRVVPGQQKEIGWGTLDLTEAGEASPLRHLAAEKTPVLHWHGDVCEVPDDVTVLASTAVTPVQAFQFKKSLGLQFHPEATVHGLERWYIGHIGEIEATDGVSVEQLRQDTEAYGYNMDMHGAAFLEDWLASL